MSSQHREHERAAHAFPVSIPFSLYSQLWFSMIEVCGDCPKLLSIRGPIFRFLL